MSFSITVAIAVSSDSRRIFNTLESLAECMIPDSLRQVLVVENGEAPRLAEGVRRFAERLPVRHVFTETIGKSPALNWAIRNYVEDESFIIFTDDDVRFNPNWLVNYETAFRRHGRGGYFGSVLGVDYEIEPAPAIKTLLPVSARGHASETAAIKRRFFLGCNWACHRSDLVAAGMFSERFGPGSSTGATGQETEMQERLRRNGVKRVYVQNNMVWHYVPREKCTFEWIKERSRRIGVESYLKTPNRGVWVRKKLRAVARSAVRLAMGDGAFYYRLIVNSVVLGSFVSAWMRLGRDARGREAADKEDGWIERRPG